MGVEGLLTVPYKTTTLILLCIALVLTGYTVLRQRHMWNEPVKIAALATAVAAVGTCLHALARDGLLPRAEDLMPALQLLKDAPGMYVVPYLATIAVDQYPRVASRRRLAAVLRASFPAFLAAFVAMTILAAVAAGIPGVGTNLEFSSSPWAFAYRVAVDAPILVYGSLLAYVHLESFVRGEGVSRRLRARYLLFAGGCSSFVVLVTLHFGWPLAALSSGAPPVSAEAVRAVQAAVFGFLALCWLSAMLLPCREDDQERRLDRFETSDRELDEFAAQLSRPERDPGEPGTDGWYTADYLLSEAGKYLGRRGLEDDDVVAARLILALFARLEGTPARAGRFHGYLTSLRSSADAMIEELPPEVPQTTLWRENPVKRALDAALFFSDEDFACKLARQPAWLQLAVLVAAHCGFLNRAQTAEIFDEERATVAPDVWNAYLYAKLSFGWNISEGIA